ncbi:MAG: GMP synthase [Chitinophagales bacterium]|nr:GMP synthase [Bacteroidota bacterium]MCB9042506.1 GMP synthase [Chitinophagales bacterium]
MQADLRIAILDMYMGEPNQGMRCIFEIIEDFGRNNGLEIETITYDVRNTAEVADLSFDVYISTGGPGSPLDSEGSLWEKRYFDLMDKIRQYNFLNPEHKKNVFLICHSFQIYCRYYELATVNKRKSTSFGVFPVHCTHAGMREPFFEQLSEVFWIVDSRDYQVVKPDIHKIHERGGAVLCIEKVRPHIPLERATMAIRFDDAFFGTQFHPEADPIGMLQYLRTDEKRKHIVEHYGQEKYNFILDTLDDTDKIILTYNTILPNFLHHAIRKEQLVY